MAVNFWDILLIALIAAALGLALRRTVAHRGQCCGGCGGNCASCPHGCACGKGAERRD